MRPAGCHHGPVGDRVLGIDVPEPLWERWWSWAAPPVQPFVVDPASPAARLPSLPAPDTPQLASTFHFWRIDRRGAATIWLDEAAFSSLSRPERAALVRQQVVRRRGAVPSVRTWAAVFDGAALRSQGDGHRFVWWPSLVAPRSRRAVLTRLVAHDQPASRHREVPATVWRHVRPLLPAAHELAGTFPEAGEHNCFGTLLAAAGRHDPADTWVDRPPVEAWLAEATEPADRRHDDRPGTVLVWRDAEGQLDHAAVTIGGGWAFEKASQDWWRPRVVLRVDELIAGKRTPGSRLERRAMR